MVLPFGLTVESEIKLSNISEKSLIPGYEYNNINSEETQLAHSLNTMTSSSEQASTNPPALPFGGFRSRSHTTHVTIGIPVIPSPYIDFIIVNDDDRYMIRCERRKILENSIVLAKIILAGPNSGRRGDPHYQITNVDKYDFELLVRFLETHFIKYDDHLHILRILELADRFKCPDLIIHSIRELDLYMSSATVIDIFRSLWFYQGLGNISNQELLGEIVKNYDTAIRKNRKRVFNINNNEFDDKIREQIQNLQNQQLLQQQQQLQQLQQLQQSQLQSQSQSQSQQQQLQQKKQPLQDLMLKRQFIILNENSKKMFGTQTIFTAEDYGVYLLDNALQLIDMHAEFILTKPQMNMLRFEEIELIVKRDSLQLHSEKTLMACLANWSKAECYRRGFEPTPENCRRVLGSLCYTPRYALMSCAEFNRACNQYELLNATEINYIKQTIQGIKIDNLTLEQKQILKQFQTPRPEYAKMPLHLSDRSDPQNYPKRMRQVNKEDDEDDCCRNMGLNCLAFLACIFD